MWVAAKVDGSTSTASQLEALIGIETQHIIEMERWLVRPLPPCPSILYGLTGTSCRVICGVVVSSQMASAASDYLRHGSTSASVYVLSS